MKIMTIFGTRPELIRLSVIIKKLDHCCTHILVDTQQNNQKNMSDIFYDELKIRPPDYKIIHKATSSFGQRMGKMIDFVTKIVIEEKPDKVLILGDTNTGLCALFIERLGVPVYHMEAGNRCFDKKVPEEINRKAIDAVSSFNLPYTEKSKQNLIADGIPINKIHVTGNPIYEVMNSIIDPRAITNSIEEAPNVPYALVTCHRAETVDNKERFTNVIKALITLSKKIKVVYPIHPRALDRLQIISDDLYEKFRENIEVIEPVGFKVFTNLERWATVILTDSGTVQEEAFILGVPAVILRDSTERTETVEAGAAIITGTNPTTIKAGVAVIKKKNQWEFPKWKLPEEYLRPNVSDIVINILLGKQL